MNFHSGPGRPHDSPFDLSPAGDGPDSRESVVGSVRDGFAAAFGGVPDGVWAAPGRVNLIGEHTDYSEGFALPIAIPQATFLAAAARDDGLLRLHSTQGDGRTTVLRTAELRPGAVTTWAAYPAGVVWALNESGYPVGGADLYFDSHVPAGAGLSSSAALECVVATAYNDLYELGLGPVDVALVAQHAENAFAGVPCGAMDQMASACSTAGRALHLDTRNMTATSIPFDPEQAGLHLLVVDTRVKHDLGDGAYAALRQGCEAAAGQLGLGALRDLPAARLPAAVRSLPADLGRLVRHVVTENARVAEAVALLNSGDIAGLGPVLSAGHASLRDDYRISCPETDLAVDAAVGAGALGARMTGGGFGGSVIALVPGRRVAPVTEAVTTAFRSAGYAAPGIFPVVPSPGARRLL